MGEKQWVFGSREIYQLHTIPDGTWNNQPNKQEEKSSMNYTTAVFLINDEVRAVKVSYEKDKENSKAPLYTYKTFEKDLKFGDYVVVPTTSRHGMTVCQVQEIDVKIDVETPTELKWIIAKFDNSQYKKILEWEADRITKIKEAQAMKKRKDLAKDLADSVNGSFDEIKSLPFPG